MPLLEAVTFVATILYASKVELKHEETVTLETAEPTATLVTY
jgi:hypothetical protein